MKTPAAKPPVHFLHIGKTGGTALIAALTPHADALNLTLHLHTTALRDVPAGEKVFFVLRDPMTRFVSGFCSRSRQGFPRYDSPWSPGEAVAYQRFSSPNELAEALTSPDETKRVWATEAMKAIQHIREPFSYWFDGADELQARAGDIVFVGFQESLKRDFAKIARMLGLPGLSLPSDDYNAFRYTGDVDRRLSPLARENLENWYAKDRALYALCAEWRREGRWSNRFHTAWAA